MRDLSRLPFTPQEYRERQRCVRAEMAARGIDLLYVTSPPNLQYLTGYEAIWFPNRLPVGVLLDREREDTRVFDWKRHQPYVASSVFCDAAHYFEYGESARVIAAAVAALGRGGARIALESFSLNPSAPVMAALADALRAQGATLLSGDWVVDKLRLYKSPAEIERVRRAAAIADRAMLRLRQALKPGLSEAEVSALLNLLLAQEGSEPAATPPLVNSGPSAWVDVHAFPSQRRLQAGDVVSVDCCAVVDRYHANLQRTFVLGPSPTRARAMIAAAAGSIEVLCREARLGEGPERAAAAAVAYVRERIPAENIWWVGGYALGLGSPPSWVGHTYLANDGEERCELREGYVSNYENVFYDELEGFEAGYIDTVVMTASGLEPLSAIPRELLEVALP
ncbi:MAG: M24 family metallopeptidase [Solimonas sp.]